MVVQLLLAANVMLFLHDGGVNKHRTVSPGDTVYEEWEKVGDKSEVQTYIRWVKVNGEKTSRERKGEFIVRCPVQDVLDVLTNAELTQKWMSGVKESYCISHVNKLRWYTYTLFSIPWPFENRDMISLNTLDYNLSEGSARIAIISKGNQIPEKKGICRMSDYTATWQLTRLGEGKTKVTFTALSTTPPVLPRFIQDPVLEKVFHNNLIQLKELLSKK